MVDSQQTMAEEPQQILVVYGQARNYQVVAPTSFGGGLAGNGQLLLHALLEYAGPPDSSLHEINPNNTVGREISHEPRGRRLRRESQVGILLNATTGAMLVKWLQENLPKIQGKAQG
jgi:hypothetical protein